MVKIYELKDQKSKFFNILTRKPNVWPTFLTKSHLQTQYFHLFSSLNLYFHLFWPLNQNFDHFVPKNLKFVNWKTSFDLTINILTYFSSIKLYFYLFLPSNQNFDHFFCPKIENLCIERPKIKILTKFDLTINILTNFSSIKLYFDLFYL